MKSYSGYHLKKKNITGTASPRQVSGKVGK